MGLQKKKNQWCLRPLTPSTPGQWSPHGKSRIPQEVVRSPTGAVSGLLESGFSPPHSSNEANQSPAVSIETTGRALRRGLCLFPARVVWAEVSWETWTPTPATAWWDNDVPLLSPRCQDLLGGSGFPISSNSKEASSIRGGLLNRKFK